MEVGKGVRKEVKGRGMKSVEEEYGRKWGVSGEGSGE